MAKFNLILRGVTRSDLTEIIEIGLTEDDFLTLRSIIKNYLKEKKYL